MLTRGEESDVMDSTSEEIEVSCIECGRKHRFPKGYLTEQGKAQYKCHVCSQRVVENKVAEKRIGDRTLLTED